MHTILVGNNRCSFVDSDPVGLGAAWDLYKKGVTEYKDKRFRIQKNQPISCELVSTPPSSQFGIGLLPAVVKILGRDKVQLIDQRVKPVKTLDYGFHFPHPFYPKQDEAVDAFLNHPLGRGILHCACASGKTPMSGKIIQTLGVTTTILVNSAQLLRQLRKEFEKFFEVEVGILGDTEYEWHPITVVLVDTLINYIESNKSSTPRNDVAKKVLESQLVISDEVHRSSSDTWFTCAMHFNNYWGLGLSATPMKNCPARDGRVMSMCGGIIARINEDDMLQVDRIAPTYVISIPCNSPMGYDAKSVPEWVSDKALITKNITRNDIIAETAAVMQEFGMRTLIPVDWETHVDKIVDSLRKYRVRFAKVVGKVKVKTRNVSVKQLQADDISCIVSTRVMDTGVDIPELACVIDAGKKSDVVTTEQTKGRVKRKKPDDEWNIGFYVVICDNTKGSLIGRYKKILKTLAEDTTCTFHKANSPDELRQLITNILTVEKAKR